MFEVEDVLVRVTVFVGGGGQVFFGTISNLMGLDVVCRATLEKGQIIHPTSNL